MSERKRPRGRPKAIDPVQVAEQAMLDYWRYGIHTRSLNQLCKRLGVSKPVFYREFGGEDGLMVAALERYRALRIAPLLTLLEAERPFREVLADMLGWLTDERETPNGCLFTKLRLLRAELGPQTVAQVGVIEQELRNALEGWYRRGMTQGAVQPDIQPAFAAHYIGAQLTLGLVQRGLQIPAQVVSSQVFIALTAVLNHDSTASL